MKTPNKKKETYYSCGGKGYYTQMHSKSVGGINEGSSIHKYPCSTCNGTGKKLSPQSPSEKKFTVSKIGDKKPIVKTYSPDSRKCKMASIETVILQNVEVQQNGIIRNSKGRLIGRLVDDVEYRGEHVKGLSSPQDEKEEEWPEWRKSISNAWWNFWNYQGTPDRDFIERFWLERIDPLLSRHSQTVRNQCLEEVEKEIEGLETAYPIDVFSEPWEGFEKDIDELAKLHGKRIDNISAYFARWQEKLAKERHLSIITNLQNK